MPRVALLALVFALTMCFTAQKAAGDDKERQFVRQTAVDAPVPGNAYLAVETAPLPAGLAPGKAGDAGARIFPEEFQAESWNAPGADEKSFMGME